MAKPSLQRRLLFSVYLLTFTLAVAIYFLVENSFSGGTELSAQSIIDKNDLQLSISTALVIFTLVLHYAIRRFLQPIREVIEALDVGVNSFRDKDFSITIHDDKYQEFSLIINLYNELAKIMREERMAIYQRELLLDTVIQSSPDALILTNQGGHIMYSNVAARTLLNQKSRLEGRKFSDIYQHMPAALFEATKNKEDGLITEKLNDETIVYNLNCQSFSLNNQQHHLYLYKNLSAEISRKENDIWKQVIRLISHELNNSLAPISSLTNSAKQVLNTKENYHMLPEMLDTISRRSKHLHQFIEQYASFARLPKPKLAPVELVSFLDTIGLVCDVSVNTNITMTELVFDTVQIEQVLINIIKNAKESESAFHEIQLTVKQRGNSVCFDVVDRGKGMNEAQLLQALLPFYTTKSEGTGVGLALCNEIVIAHGGKLRLQNRIGGGLKVSFSLSNSKTIIR